MYYTPNASSIVSSLTTNDEIIIRPYPSDYDENALGVFVGSKRVGWIPAAVSKFLSEEMKCFSIEFFIAKLNRKWHGYEFDSYKKVKNYPSIYIDEISYDDILIDGKKVKVVKK